MLKARTQFDLPKLQVELYLMPLLAPHYHPAVRAALDAHIMRRQGNQAGSQDLIDGMCSKLPEAEKSLLRRINNLMAAGYFVTPDPHRLDFVRKAQQFKASHPEPEARRLFTQWFADQLGHFRPAIFVNAQTSAGAVSAGLYRRIHQDGQRKVSVWAAGPVATRAARNGVGGFVQETGARARESNVDYGHDGGICIEVEPA